VESKWFKASIFHVPARARSEDQAALAFADRIGRREFHENLDRASVAPDSDGGYTATVTAKWGEVRSVKFTLSERP
jgi:hypothetical protein